MKIGINGFVVDMCGGGNTYFKNLINAIAEIDKTNIYYIFINKENELKNKINQQNIIFINSGLSRNNQVGRVLYEQIMVPIEARKRGLDIYFLLSDIAPLLINRAKVITTFQNNQFYLPAYSDEIKGYRRLYFSILAPNSLKRSSRIVAVSNSARNDLVRYDLSLANKIRVVYEGVNRGAFYPKKPEDKDNWGKIKKEYGIRGNYILFVSTLRSFKNADKLIKAYNQLKQDGKMNIQLVIIGNPVEKGYVLLLREMVEQFGLNEDVVFINAVDEATLRLFYVFSSLLVYPSSLETFGLPPLEAMACGCPVITSNRAAMPEIAGEAALVIDPDNVEDLVMAIHQLLNDDNLKTRLVQKGYERISHFSWEKAAQEILGLFEEVYQQA